MRNVVDLGDNVEETKRNKKNDVDPLLEQLD